MIAACDCDPHGTGAETHADDCSRHDSAQDPVMALLMCCRGLELDLGGWLESEDHDGDRMAVTGDTRQEIVAAWHRLRRVLEPFRP